LDTALNWEDNAAFIVLGSSILALAYTAAAHFSLVVFELPTDLLGDRSILGEF
jgi:hypothetical protein